MTSTVLNFPVTLADPQIKTLQRIGSAYLTAWQTQHYAFLPPLHELLGRHGKLLTESVEGFHAHAQRIHTWIRAGDLNQIIKDIEALDDPLDIAEYLEVGQDALVSIADALGKQMAALKRVLVDLGALGVYNASRDLTRYQGELAKLASDQLARASEVARREAELASLDAAIKVLEAANVEAIFTGSVPSTQQIKDAAAVIASGGVTVEAVENALKQIGDLIGNALEGMRYSRILDQRRDLQKTLDELHADVRAMERRQRDTQSNCERLAEYPALVTQREQGRLLFSQIIDQLGPVLRQLSGYQVQTVASLLAVHPLVVELHAYARKVLADFSPGQ